MEVLNIYDRDGNDNYSGFTFTCDMYASFYNGTTFVSDVLIGQYSKISPSDYRPLSYTFVSKTLSVLINE